MKWYEKLLRWGFCQNQWAWFHMTAAIIGAKVGLLVCTPLRSLLYVALIALAWEVIEFMCEQKGQWENIILTYGSKERWFYDSLGDVILAVACAGIVVC